MVRRINDVKEKEKIIHRENQIKQLMREKSAIITINVTVRRINDVKQKLFIGKPKKNKTVDGGKIRYHFYDVLFPPRNGEPAS
jgi:hypothetical protein